jgi:AraC-like DNA-binding protein
MSVFLGLILRNTQASYEDEIYRSRLNTLVRIQDALNLRVRECRNMALQLAQNTLTSEYSLTQTTYDSYLGIQELRKYKSGNEFLHDLALYFGSSGFLFSSQGATTIKVALQDQYRLLDQDVIELERLLKETDHVTAYAANNSTRLFLIIPMNQSFPNTNRAILFVFDEYSMLSLFRNYVTEPLEYRYLLDQNNQLLYVADHDNHEILQQHKAIIELSDQENSEIVTYDHNPYQIVSTESSTTGWRLVSILPMRLIRPIYRNWQLLISITAVVLVVCFVLAAWFSSSYWQPVRNLGSQLTGSNPNKYNWDTINDAVSRIMVQNQSFSHQLELHRQTLRDNLVLRLLQGNYDHAEDLASELHKVGLSPHVTGFCALAISIDETCEKHQGSMIQQSMDAILAKHMDSLHLVETRKDNTSLVGIIFVSSNDKSAAQTELRCIVDDIDQTIKEHGRLKYHIGAGRIVQAVDDVKFSYMQSVIVLNNHMNEWTEENNQHIIYSDTTTSDALVQPEIRENDMYLTLAMKQGDTSTAVSVLKKIEREIYAQNTVLVQYSCYKLLDTIISFISTNGSVISFEDAFNENTSLTTLLEMINRNSHEPFFTSLERLVTHICHAVEKDNQIKDTQMIQHIISFVENNYTDQNFSLESVSEAFGSTIHYWSRFFRDRIKHNFSDYVWNLRLRLAKDLLIQSDRPLQDIVDEIGYIDTRSFIRKFKNSEGITPNQYKKIHGKNNSVHQQP